VKRVGLLATQGIRGGKNRVVLDRIKRDGDILFAVSDRNWVIEGANVHVSLIGFDDGSETHRVLDGAPVAQINSNLTATADANEAKRLAQNFRTGFIGTTKKAPLDVAESLALNLLVRPNPAGCPNSDVIFPFYNGEDVTRASKRRWIIDFAERSLEESSQYADPFKYVVDNVRSIRVNHREERQKQKWWLLARPCQDMKDATYTLPRYIASPRVSKHRLFVWLTPPIEPDCQLIVFTRSDDYFFGVLHSRPHELWTRSQGTQVRERESGFRYTPTTCFETFPFPEPTEAQCESIAQAAKRLDELRSNWLNPPEWTREDVLEFPGSVDGPWARYVHDPDERGIGTVRYVRRVAKDAYAPDLAKRTLTNLYNERPTWLDLAHRALDEAVFAAYGWDPALSDDDLLAALLELNLARAGAGDPGAPPDEAESEAL
jgi:hypothetical protein